MIFFVKQVCIDGANKIMSFVFETNSIYLWFVLTNYVIYGFLLIVVNSNPWTWSREQVCNI